MAAAPTRAPARRARGLRRLALAVASALLTLCALELVLHLASRRFVEQLLASRASDAAPDARTVLCVGDSYTFGLYYRAEEAYPGRLEQLLRAGDPAPPGEGARWRVENSGIPAQNLAQVAARLPEQLARLRPVAVVILAGFNDRWNFATPDGARTGEARGLAAWFADRVIVKLARLAAARSAADEGAGEPLDGGSRFRHFAMDRIELAGDDAGAAITIEEGATRLVDDAHYSAVAERLRAVVAVIEAAGALPLLCSYPSPEALYEPPSRAAATVAAERGLPFVDLRAAFAAELARHRYDELLIPGDRHPTDRGYWRMAVRVAQALAERGTWTPAPPLATALRDAVGNGYAVAPLPEQLHPVTLTRAEPDGNSPAPHVDGNSPAPRFVLTGPPAAHWKVVLAAADAPAQRFGALELAMAADALFAKSGDDERCEGQFDAAGRATFTLPADYAAEARFIALAVLHDLRIGGPDLLVRGIAGPLPLE
ncbi:MAG: hypothetical protein JNL90_16460 [Planctomycetes bacterium]|nr:hypothetical protein [Planctomycetota bacterium]